MMRGSKENCSKNIKILLDSVEPSCVLLTQLIYANDFAVDCFEQIVHETIKFIITHY